MKKVTGTIGSSLLFLAVSAQVALADVPINIVPTGIIKPGADVTVQRVVTFVVAILSVVAVLAALAYLVWGAIKWITSGGDKTKVEAARSQIVAAIIGFIIVVLSFVILNVVGTVLGVGNIFNLNIGTL